MNENEKKFKRRIQIITVIPMLLALLLLGFSIFENGTIFLSIISVLFILLLNHYIKKESNTFDIYEVISFGMIMGGIFGNLIDRIIHHGVIDYLSFTFGSYQFAIFNFADMCIVLGVLLLVMDFILFKKSKNRK